MRLVCRRAPFAAVENDLYYIGATSRNGIRAVQHYNHVTNIHVYGMEVRQSYHAEVYAGHEMA